MGKPFECGKCGNVYQSGDEQWKNRRYGWLCGYCYREEKTNSRNVARQKRSKRKGDGK